MQVKDTLFQKLYLKAYCYADILPQQSLQNKHETYIQ